MAKKNYTSSIILTALKVVIRLAVFFFVSTILAVVFYKFVPVYITPLMVIRTVEGAPSMQHHWVPLSEMSPNMARAVITCEDQRFMYHYGFDFNSIQSAMEHNKHSDKKLGASTISQQTAKNVFLWPDRTWVRKGLEAYFTVLIEFIWGKERIMEVYLNSIEMGDGIYGADAVAQAHFNKTAAELSARECALIAYSLRNPIIFSSKNPPQKMQRALPSIIRQMKYCKTVTTDDKEKDQPAEEKPKENVKKKSKKSKKNNK